MPASASMPTVSANEIPAINRTMLWTPNECAVHLGKSARWIWAALSRLPKEKGSIPHVRIGRSPRFFPEDIREWVRLGCPPAETLADWKKPKERSNTTP